MKKQGISETISVLLFVVLALVAVLILWFFVKQFLFSSLSTNPAANTTTVTGNQQNGGLTGPDAPSQIDVAATCLDAPLVPTQCSFVNESIATAAGVNWYTYFANPVYYGGNVYYVELQRGAGQGNLIGMRYIFEDSNGVSYTLDWKGKRAHRNPLLPQPLDTVGILFNSTTGPQFNPVRVSVAARLAGSNGYCQPVGGNVECLPAKVTDVGADIDNDGSPPEGVCDGGVDISDLLYFLAEFEAGSLGADISPPPYGDGRITPEDLISFLSAFEAGRGGNCKNPTPR